MDVSNDRLEKDKERELARISAAAAMIPPGEPGECDRCEEYSPRVVRGACAPCRDRYGLP